MFTGLVEEVGRIARVQPGAHSAVLHIQAEAVLEGLKVGDSVAVNGVCLTATEVKRDGFSADVMHETLRRAGLSALRAGSPVNLERALAADGRFGGHIVSGHVDGQGVITRVTRDGNAVCFTIEAPPALLRYIVEKGSIAVDGVSLTVARVTDRDFSISAIPHTVAATALRFRRAGDRVNLENDIIGKYVEKLLSSPAEKAEKSALTKGFFARCGYAT